MEENLSGRSISLDGFAMGTIHSMVVAEATGNSLSLMSEELAHLARYDSAENGKNSYQALEGWAVQSARDLQKSHQLWCSALIEQRFPQKAGKAYRVSAADCYVGQLTDRVPILLNISPRGTKIVDDEL